MMVQAWHNGAPSTVKVVKISHTRNGVEMYLTPDAAMAWEQMCIAAERDGYVLTANSAWRSYDLQKRIFEKWKDAHDRWLRLPADTRGKGPPRPAEPGKSLHHNGIAVDIQRSHGDPDGAGPAKSPTDIWLQKNAHLFGFKQPYPSREPWHYEFTGQLPEEF